MHQANESDESEDDGVLVGGDSKVSTASSWSRKQQTPVGRGDFQS